MINHSNWRYMAKREKDLLIFIDNKNLTAVTFLYPCMLACFESVFKPLKWIGPLARAATDRQVCPTVVSDYAVMIGNNTLPRVYYNCIKRGVYP